jgi:predicted O-methyltransferase YrrM
MASRPNLLRRLFINEIRTLFKWRQLKPIIWAPHGHFYSPIVSRTDLDLFEEAIWADERLDGIDGIKLDTVGQTELLAQLSAYYSEMPFTEQKNNNFRYFFNNNSYRHTDAIILYSFIRHYQPNRIIEIGSGFTSAIMLDTRDLSHRDIKLTFIEPYPGLLRSLLKPGDLERCEILETKVQQVSLELFKSLEANDILFVDSSHVSKTGSDVNFEIFKILPVLKPGVIIHFHDIFYPFEYPKDWVRDGRNWNEDYLLRAFLSHNDKYSILLFSDYIHKHHARAFEKMPLTYKNTGGSLWIKKLGN